MHADADVGGQRHVELLSGTLARDQQVADIEHHGVAVVQLVAILIGSHILTSGVDVHRQGFDGLARLLVLEARIKIADAHVVGRQVADVDDELHAEAAYAGEAIEALATAKIAVGHEGISDILLAKTAEGTLLGSRHLLGLHIVVAEEQRLVACYLDAVTIEEDVVPSLVGTLVLAVYLVDAVALDLVEEGAGATYGLTDGEADAHNLAAGIVFE